VATPKAQRPRRPVGAAAAGPRFAPAASSARILPRTSAISASVRAPSSLAASSSSSSSKTSASSSGSACTYPRISASSALEASSSRSAICAGLSAGCGQAGRGARRCGCVRSAARTRACLARRAAPRGPRESHGHIVQLLEGLTVVGRRRARPGHRSARASPLRRRAPSWEMATRRNWRGTTWPNSSPEPKPAGRRRPENRDPRGRRVPPWPTSDVGLDHGAHLDHLDA
jgi:hypothetical protein